MDFISSSALSLETIIDSSIVHTAALPEHDCASNIIRLLAYLLLTTDDATSAWCLLAECGPIIGYINIYVTHHNLADVTEAKHLITAVSEARLEER